MNDEKDFEEWWCAQGMSDLVKERFKDCYLSSRLAARKEPNARIKELEAENRVFKDTKLGIASDYKQTKEQLKDANAVIDLIADGLRNKTTRVPVWRMADDHRKKYPRGSE